MKIICTAQPIFDKSGKMIQILSTSKHIEEITDKVKHLSLELSSSNEKIKNLQEQVIAKNRYIFESPPMRQIQKVILKIAPTDVSVLVEGESGVGKEVIADVIYHLSHRKDKPFIKINCGLIPKELMESELFGYEAGAFTGALKNGKTGKLEIANGGTVFFDEIGEMELPLQVKLLEFIQDRLIMRVGGTKRIPIDVRIIAATNKDLFTMVEQGTFRQDLYYRLNVMPLYIPPLRERREDIVPLIFHFLNMLNKKYGCDKHMDNSVVEKMQSYHWPGNVRELMHAIERIVVASESDYINSVSLDDLFMEGMTPYGIAITPSAKVICTGLMPLKEAKEKLEGNLVRMAYEQFGSSYKAAELLQVNQSTVNRWLKRVNDNANKHSV
jgi:transcriptional regulator with PAS, ATPase and Fis domain